jgi:DEAD/DEAH box helicase domain-containing protein
VRWVATKPDALIPRPDWGCGEIGGPFVRAEESQALSVLPDLWQRIHPDDLHQTAPGVIALTIHRELDGPSATFGDRAWMLLEEQAPELAGHLSGAAPLQSVIYSDRYLRSPLAFVLLRGLLEGLARYPGGLTPTTVIQIDTAKLDRPTAETPRCYSMIGGIAGIVNTLSKPGFLRRGPHSLGGKSYPQAASCPRIDLDLE